MQSNEAWSRIPAVDLSVPEELIPQRPPLQSVMVLDTETTGLEDWARVVEIACAEVSVPEGRTLREAAALIHPGCPIPPAASAVHGIADDAVAGAASLAVVLPRVIAWLQASPASVVVAHNAPFDLARLRYDAGRVGVPLPGRIPFYCSVELARLVMPGRARAGGYRLQALAAHFGVRVDTAHRAMADVRTTGAVVKELLGTLSGQGKDLRGALRPVGHL